MNWPRHVLSRSRQGLPGLACQFIFSATCWLSLATASAMAQRTALLSDGRELLKTGKYEECLTTSLEAIQNGDDALSWWEFALRSQLELGQYAEADALL